MNAETANVKSRSPRRKSAKGRGAQAKNVDPSALLNTPEGQKLLDDAVERRMQDLLARLEAGRSEKGTEGNDGDHNFVRQLALAIAEIGDHDKRRVYVSPEEMDSRMAARAEMETLIVEARAKGDVAKYDLTREVYLEEQIIFPSFVGPDHVRRVQQIEWAGVPDESMRPANDTAEAIYKAFMRSIGGRTRESKVPYKHSYEAPDKNSAILRVLGKDANRATETPITQRHTDQGNLRVLRPQQPGQITETRVLGTLAQPARQVG